MDLLYKTAAMSHRQAEADKPSFCKGKTDRKPGDFGLRGFYPQDAKGQYEMQVKVLKVLRVPDEQPKQAGKQIAHENAMTIYEMVVRHASTSKSMPFLPKPQNLGGLAGGEAEFDPLGFSDTFDVFQQHWQS
eukprot:Skav218661  [mRNA]  locus=scaffold365:853980:855377:- [translate_table: standard]